jgi:hypothetical protein
VIIRAAYTMGLEADIVVDTFVLTYSLSEKWFPSSGLIVTQA